MRTHHAHVLFTGVALAFLAILCQVKAKLASMVWGHHLGVLGTKPS